MTADEFLTKFTERLRGDNWGTIDDEWFNPEFLVLEDDQEEPSQEQEWARQLQGYIKDILEEEEKS